MASPPVPPELSAAREQFFALLGDLRPELHRYCARLVGSAIDGEDVVQEALAKAFYALSLTPELPALRPWLFRIAHNTAIDLLRRYERRHVESAPDPVDPCVADDAVDPAVVRAALTSFLALPIAQRSAVILKDVLGHSLDEIAAATGATIPAIKAALVRGRTALQSRPHAAERPALPDPETRARLGRYAALFNARDWDGVRALLLAECRLDLVAKSARQGPTVNAYWARYAQEPDARLRVGTAEGRPVLGLFRGDAARPDSIITLEWAGDRVALIRDFRYVPYILADLEFHELPAP